MGNPYTTGDYLRGGKMSSKEGRKAASLARSHTSLFVHLRKGANEVGAGARAAPLPPTSLLLGHAHLMSALVWGISPISKQ